MPDHHGQERAQLDFGTVASRLPLGGSGEAEAVVNLETRWHGRPSEFAHRGNGWRSRWATGKTVIERNSISWAIA